MNVTVLQIHALTSERDCLCAKVSELTAVSLVLSLIASFMLKWLNSFLWETHCSATECYLPYGITQVLHATRHRRTFLPL